MNVWTAEWRRWWTWLWRGFEGPMLVAVGMAAPVVGYGLVIRSEGVLPLVNVAVLASVVPLMPLAWALAGVRWALPDRPRAAGTLRPSWPASRATLMSAAVLPPLTSGLAGGSVTTGGFLVVLLVLSHGSVMVGAGSVLTCVTILGLTDALMLAFGTVVGTWMPGRWAGLVAVGLPVMGLAAGTLLSDGGGSWTEGLGAFLATTPWGWFVNKSNAAFGFGPYLGVFWWTVAGMALALGVGAAVSVGRQWHWPRRERPMAWALSAVWAATLAGAVASALATRPDTVALPATAILSRIHGPRLSGERLTVTFGPGGGLSAAATVTPSGPGIVWLWLNPQLTVQSIVRAGRPLAVRRRPDGLLAVPSGGAFTVRYGGGIHLGINLIPQVRRTLDAVLGPTPPSLPDPMTAFTSTGSVLLPAGTWYPIPAADFAHPRHPEAMTVSVTVARSGAPPPVILSNLGRLLPGHARRRRTTGATLVGGRLVPTAKSGAQIWSGPETAWSWRHLPPGTLGWSNALATWARAMGVDRPVLIAEPWGPGSSFMTGLGNPNPVVWDHYSNTPHQRDALMGVFSAFQAPYANTAAAAPPAAARGLWAALSSRWLDAAGLPLLPMPAWQMPALTAMTSLVNLAVPDGAGWGPPPNPTLFAQWSPGHTRAYFRGLGRLLRHGWPSASRLTALTRQVLHPGGRP